MRQEMMGFWDGSGISWTICKQSVPRFRQTTTPTPHHSMFTDWMLFLTPNQQCQSTEGIMEAAITAEYFVHMCEFVFMLILVLQLLNCAGWSLAI